ncbi:MAG: tyrosine--tRNA ligase, partial [Saprospiraceae bacterium]
DCTLQMGGSDQWGNITTGTEFVRRNLQGKAYAVTTPLLTKADGSKFGKSEKGNLWIDEKFTSPYEFYQFWINCDDRDIPKFMRYFTYKTKEEVEALEAEHPDNKRPLKEALAEELTTRVFSEAAYQAAKNVSTLLFAKKSTKEQLVSLDAANLEIVSQEIQSKKIAKEIITNSANILDVLVDHTDILASKGEGRRAIKGNAIAVNKEKVNSHEFTLTSDMLLHDKYIMIENGKKNKFMLIAE